MKSVGKPAGKITMPVSALDDVSETVTDVPLPAGTVRSTKRGDHEIAGPFSGGGAPSAESAAGNPATVRMNAATAPANVLDSRLTARVLRGRLRRRGIRAMCGPFLGAVAPERRVGLAIGMSAAYWATVTDAAPVELPGPLMPPNRFGGVCTP